MQVGSMQGASTFHSIRSRLLGRLFCRSEGVSTGFALETEQFEIEHLSLPGVGREARRHNGVWLVDLVFCLRSGGHVAAMGLCKCRKVTTLFCFQCRINVCDTCIVSCAVSIVCASVCVIIFASSVTSKLTCFVPVAPNRISVSALAIDLRPTNQVEKHKTCVVNKYMQWLLDSEWVYPLCFSAHTASHFMVSVCTRLRIPLSWRLRLL